MVRRLRIALAQINPLVGDVEGNARRIIDTAVDARDRLGADLIVYPELALTAYPPEDLLLRPGLFHRLDQAMEAIGREATGVHLLIGTPTRAGVEVYNSAVLMRDGKRLGVYHKQELPNYQVFDEKRYFTPGGTACVVPVNGVRVGVTICEDIWQAAPMRRAAQSGADLIVNLNASPYHLQKDQERVAVLRQRVAEMGLPVLYVNQVGGQDELVFDGESLAMNRGGELVLRAAAFEEGLHAVDFVDGEFGASTVAADGLDEDESVYRALVLGIRDYVRKNQFEGVVLGLSGGIDSALTLVLAVDALGSAAVHAVMMPSRYTSTMSLEDARDEAGRLGVDYTEISIEPAFQAFLDALSEAFSGTSADTTEENLQARARGIILMAMSNKRGRMVLSTGNKSEMAVGYATLYGDMAGGFAPLKDVAKTRVYRLAAYRNAIREVIPSRVIVRPPSAELAPDQTDQDSLPPYEVLDPILERFVERDWSIEQIAAEGYERETVVRVARMVLRNEYKRRQAPPGVRITRRAFGKDRRYPITSGYADHLR